MLENFLRPSADKWFFHPIAKKLNHFTFVSANNVTLLSIVVGICAAWSIAFNWLGAAVILLILSGLGDILDGSLARIANTSSDWGSMLDIMGDRCVETAIIIGFYWQNAGRGFYCVLMLGSILLCVTSFLLVGLFSEKQSHKSFYYSPGLIERFEAFLFFFAMLLLPGHFNIISLLFSSLVLFTAIYRFLNLAGSLS